jgi:hypothetical protein
MVTRRLRVAILLYTCAILLLGVALAELLMTADSSRLYHGLVPFKQPLTTRGVRGSFAAVWSEPHEVVVSLPARSGIAQVDAFVERATDLVGLAQDRPAFDITWQVYQAGVLVGSGSGGGGASAVSFGQGTRGFAFGTFPLTAGKTYDVVVDVGPQFAPLLQASPSVEVDVASATASVGLAFSRSLGPTITWVIGALGGLVLGVALWYQHAGRGRPTRSIWTPPVKRKE